MALNSDVKINLDDDVDIKTENLSDNAVKKNLILAEILSSPAHIEVISNCEQCDATLATPVILVYSASDDGMPPRDSSTVCDANCTE